MSLVDRIIWLCIAAVIGMVILWAVAHAKSSDDEYWRDFRRDSEAQACREKWTEALRDECFRQLYEKYRYRRRRCLGERTCGIATASDE
jgi:hypothetical protein